LDIDLRKRSLSKLNRSASPPPTTTAIARPRSGLYCRLSTYLLQLRQRRRVTRAGFRSGEKAGTPGRSAASPVRGGARPPPLAHLLAGTGRVVFPATPLHLAMPDLESPPWPGCGFGSTGAETRRAMPNLGAKKQAAKPSRQPTGAGVAEGTLLLPLPPPAPGPRCATGHGGHQQCVEQPLARPLGLGSPKGKGVVGLKMGRIKRTYLNGAR
jgi:hypothetical protein